MKNRNELIQDALAFIEKSDSGYTPEIVADFVIQNKRIIALDNLRETVGMWCECCPVEVQQALHAIPGNDIQHPGHPFEEPDARMDRLQKQEPKNE